MGVGRPTEADRARQVAERNSPARGSFRVAWVYRAGWLAFRAFFSVWFRWRVRGAEHVPAAGPCILAANHASYLDPPLVGAACRRPISYLARDTLFENRFFGRLLRAVGVVPVDRDGASGAGIKPILDRLLAGEAIVLFPEGTRSSDGELRQARPGIGFVVMKSGAPVIPVRLFGTFAAFGRHHTLPRPVRVTVVFGRPLDLTAQRDAAATADREQVKQLYRQVAHAIMEAIAQLDAREGG